MGERLVATTLGNEDAVVVFEELPSAGTGRIGHARLNVPATLNSLSLEMIDLLQPALDHWAQRDDIAAVFLSGTGDRAFCAGGDIQALRDGIVRNHAAGEVVDRYPFDFFQREYELDYALHRYAKPVVTLGHGVVMGGGLGLFSGSRYRVVTQTSRIALPEVTIGLFPDAGATWQLKQLPIAQATFMAMTGSQVNANDALQLGIATHVVDQDQRADLLVALTALDLGADPEANHAGVASCLEQQEQPTLPEAQMHAVSDALAPVGSTREVFAAVAALEGSSEWVDKGIKTMRNGCPTSIGVIVEQLKRLADVSLEESFQLEMTIATHCALNRDFAEGVRALLVDKDGAPQWQYADLDQLPDAHVAAHFVEPWPQNPLANLGE